MYHERIHSGELNKKMEKPTPPSASTAAEVSAEGVGECGEHKKPYKRNCCYIGGFVVELYFFFFLLFSLTMRRVVAVMLYTALYYIN